MFFIEFHNSPNTDVLQRMFLFFTFQLIFICLATNRSDNYFFFSFLFFWGGGQLFGHSINCPTWLPTQMISGTRSGSRWAQNGYTNRRSGATSRKTYWNWCYLWRVLEPTLFPNRFWSICRWCSVDLRWVRDRYFAIWSDLFIIVVVLRTLWKNNLVNVCTQFYKKQPMF